MYLTHAHFPGIPTFLLHILILQEPSSGLDTFIGYQIMISPAPPLPLTTPILRPLTPGISLYNYTIRGLANFTVYTITVATYNDDGVGPLTAQRTVRTPETGKGVLIFLILAE